MKLKKGQKVIKPKKTNKLNKKAENDKKLKMAKSVMEMYEKKDFPVEKQNGKKKAENTIKEIDNNPEKEQHVKPQKNKRQLKKVLGQEGLLVKHEEGVKWYSYQFDKTRNETEKLNTAENAKLLEEGREILAQDSALLQTHDKQDNASEAAWLYSVLTKGTAADKRTAMQLQMHKSPVHSLEYVEKLVSACTKQGARDVVDIIPILEDIFLNHCLPENRKLVVFSKRPIDELTELSSGNLRSRKKILMLWAFEHELKLLYQKYIDVLVNIVKKPLEELGKRALKSLATCLATRPESEELLLSSLVNTFGHPNYKIGSYVIFLMEDLIRKHPAMKSVVVEEIERLIFRKNVNDRALLYSTTFLSQMKFSQKDGTLCCHLMKIYLSLFKTIVGKKITDTRILPIVLSGANRAFPYAKEVDKLLEDVNDVYYLAHNSNFRTAIPALKLLFQFHKMNDYITDRFYSALYRKLLDNCPAGAYAQLLKLLFDTMKDDPSAQRVRSFVKRLLQVAVNVQAEFAASILLLISKIKKLRKNETLVVVVKDADPTAKLNEKLQANDDEEDDEEKYVDLDNEGNEILPGKPKTEDEIDNDEVIVDNEKVEEKKVEKGKLGVASNDGWVHRKMLGKKSSKSPYDTDTRNPLYVDASQCADNELLLLANHYHPSVAVFAKTLLHGGEISYGGDALTDLTLMSFLDRFAFRNPKEISKTAEKRVVRKKQHDPWGVRKLLVKSEEYTKKRRDEIPADERFLHRYTSILNKEKMGKPEKKEEDEWDYAESVNSEEFDAIMERFEPGELNEEFDIDYSKEFSSEKNRRKKDVTDEVDIDEDDDLDDLDDDEDDDDGNEQGNDDDDDDEDDDDDDDDDEDEEEDEDGKIGGGKYNNIFEEDEDSSDDDIRENDYELAGDKFGEMLEDLEDEEESKKKKKGQKRGGKGAGPKSKKPRRR